MKTTLISLILAFLSIYTFAQAPEGFNYQGIARDNQGKELANKSISLRLSILQSSPAGTSVYSESHAITTNGLGLFTVKIGGGSVISGIFNQIDWPAGTFYLKVEMDPDGDTNYTLMGTNQMLSVPYALYSKTSGSKGGHYVGELYGGGVIFYVDQNGIHGLICCMIDLSTEQVWSNINTTLIGSNAQSDWDGNSNSIAVTGQSGHTSSAAQLCLNYTNADYATGIFSDWYLPSKGELILLYNNIYSVQKALDTDGNPSTNAMLKVPYWSSTESDVYSYTDRAWTLHFAVGTYYYYNKNSPQAVRAVRAF